VLVKITYILLLCVNLYSTLKAQDNSETVHLLSNILKIESVTGNEKNYGVFLKNYCQDKGLHITVFSDADSSYNFAASLYPLSDGKPNVIFLSHLDVVDAGDISKWKHLPYAGVIEDSIIWGRGAIDCKGLAAAQVVALSNFVDTALSRELPYNITFLAVSGEEDGSKRNGCKFVVNHYLNLLNPVAVFGEGGAGMVDIIDSKPDMQLFGISVAEKSALWLQLNVDIQAAGHGSVPPVFYANKRLLRSLMDLLDEKRLVKFDTLSKNMFKAIGQLEGGVKGFVIRHIYWKPLWPFVKNYFTEGEVLHSLVYNTFVVTGLYSNHIAPNQISPVATAILDCRLLPNTDIHRFLRKVENVLGNKVEVTVIGQSPAAPASSKENIFYRAMYESIQMVYPQSAIYPILFPGSTDNNYFRSAGIPTYGVFPTIFSQAQMNTVHAPNEYISVQQLNKACDTFNALISNLIK